MPRKMRTAYPTKRLPFHRSVVLRHVHRDKWTSTTQIASAMSLMIPPECAVRHAMKASGGGVCSNASAPIEYKLRTGRREVVSNICSAFLGIGIVEKKKENGDTLWRLTQKGVAFRAKQASQTD